MHNRNMEKNINKYFKNGIKGQYNYNNPHWIWTQLSFLVINKILFQISLKLTVLEPVWSF